MRNINEGLQEKTFGRAGSPDAIHINWKELEKKSLDQTINTLAMASPFSLEEKQILLETNNINKRKAKRNNYNYNGVPGPAGGRKRGGPAIRADTVRGGRKGDPQHINVVGKKIPSFQRPNI